ncbi:MAG: ParB N-terminal domain-containing protein [Acidimicrobiia bacterium]|nr:ParB N-terminal domain-containing protein [Acidimicrobiia bacterium]MBT8246967.1 ParB N-terminal domain-containing protein [Acidimicrobiia bacterium]NNF08770.1 ParB N-terminal domain-containing protein [Acidimicrobiia bacterium]NNL14354.1 ParB N-terminal domain-containing protein [Acidimicrobiia bacterium]RZV44311.1 MAG: hypothetical protein EX267_06980 [Acidimicrobiia bacterium]
MTWYPQDTYERARWQESRHRIAKVVQGQQPDQLMELDDVQGRLALFQQSYVGVRPIRVDQIVGSVDKSEDFDKDFRPRTPRSKHRWEQVERAFPRGDFPPIDVYQVDDTFYVIDGHHRVGVAKAREIEFIDADITELHSPYELKPEDDLGDIIHLQQRRLFLHQSGLGRVRPDARIEFSRPVGYVQLLENLEVHGYHLQQQAEQVLSKEAVAADWYDNVYLKNVAEIEAVGLDKLMGHTPVSDLYLWVHQKRQSLFPEQGSISFRTAAEDLAAEEARKLGPRTKATVDRVEDTVGGALGRLLGRKKPDEED